MESRKTFVLWISLAAPAGGDGSAMAGRLEDVDTGVERRFGSADQLIALLEQRLQEDASGERGAR